MPVRFPVSWSLAWVGSTQIGNPHPKINLIVDLLDWRGLLQRCVAVIGVLSP